MAEEPEEEKVLIDKLKPRTEDETPAAARPEMMEQVDVHQLAAEMLKEEGVDSTFCLTISIALRKGLAKDLAIHQAIGCPASFASCACSYCLSSIAQSAYIVSSLFR